MLNENTKFELAQLPSRLKCLQKSEWKQNRTLYCCKSKASKELYQTYASLNKVLTHS